MHEKEDLLEDHWFPFVRRLFAELDRLAPEARIEAAVSILESTQDPFLRLNAKIWLTHWLGEYVQPIDGETPKRVRWLAEIEAVKLLPRSLWERIFRLWGLENLLQEALARGDLFVAQHFATMLVEDARRRTRKFFVLEGIPGSIDAGDVLEAVAEREGGFLPRVRRAAERRLRPTDPRREREESQLGLPEDAPSPLETALSNEPDPVEVLVADEEPPPDLTPLLESLKEEDRLLLSTLTGERTEEEVANLLGVAVTALRKRRQRLIARIRKQLPCNLNYICPQNRVSPVI